jgi:Tol biopolymer transport system component
MKRGLGCLVLLCLAGCGAAHAAPLGPAKPVANVLVYAKAGPAIGHSNLESVWRARLDGSHRKLLASNSQDPSVSPDGRWIAYGSGAHVLVIPTTGRTATIVYTLHGNGTDLLEGPPTWAPDSRHIGFFGNGGLVILDVRTMAQTTLDGAIASFSFSPDSRRIVYGTGGPSGGNLYVASIHGGPTHKITDDRKSMGPIWGAEGIAFIRFTHHAHGDIWLTGPRRGDGRQLTHTGAAFWPAYFSADGKELLAANPAMHNGRLWAVDVSTGRARPLTAWVGDLFPQGLSADGKTVLAAIGCGGMIGPYGYVETIPYAGGKPHVIVRGPCRASWNAGS